MSYQAKISETSFEAEAEDGEGTKLFDYRRPDKEVIAKFIAEGREDVMLVGGISGAGKTHALKEMLAPADQLFVTVSQAEDGQSLPTLTDRNLRCVFLDEGMRFMDALDHGEEIIVRRVEEFITRLIRRKIKVVITGGGRGYTGQEQIDLLAQYMLPQSASYTSHDFKLKTLNLIQTIELVQALKGCSPEYAAVIARAILRVHRIPAIINDPRIHDPNYWFDHPHAPYSILLRPDLRQELALEQRRRFLESTGGIM